MFLAFVAALFVTFVATANANGDASAVRVEQHRCNALDQEALRVALEVETADVPRPRHAPPITVNLRCELDMVFVTAQLPEGARRGQRFQLTEVQGDVGARVLALAIAELVRTPEAAPQKPPGPTAYTSPKSIPSGAPKSARLSLEGTVTSAQFRGPTPIGADLSLDYLGFAPLRLRADVGFGYGVDGRSVGDVATSLATGNLAAGAAFPSEPFEVAVLAGYRLGVARMQGAALAPPEMAIPVQDGNVSGPFGGPHVTLGFAVHAGGSFVISAGAELGWVLAAVVGEVTGGEDVALDGYWTRFALGVGFEL